MQKQKYNFFIVLWILFITSSPLSNAQLPRAVGETPLPSLAPMLEAVTPAVVNIATRTRIRAQENPLMNDPFFRFFFEDFMNTPRRPRERLEQSLGSGVIIDAQQGYVITNQHVINKAQEIVVTLRDGRKLNAELVGADPETDVALLKIPTENLTEVPLADSDALRVGDFVVAIGNPFGLGQTVTSGIVSALGRTGLGIEGYEDFIQTDASINPGNSGGALVNLRGELVGINTAIIAPGGGNVGIGFAIPSNMANSVVQQLAEYGEVKRGVMGINIQDLSPDLAEAFDLKGRKGAVIAGVEKDSPAAKAGLQASDVIVAINGRAVSSAADARNQIGLFRIGERVRLEVIRDGKQRTFRVKIADIKDLRQGMEGADISPYLEGMALEETDEGIGIINVTRGSYAWQAGFRANDRIVGFNRRPVTELATLQEFMRRTRPPYLLQIKRGESNRVISILLR